MSDEKSKHSPTSRADTAEIPSTRWWESYLVRYFIGFIVGSICVFVIAAQLNLTEVLFKNLASTSSTGKPDWSTIALLILFLGVGYCYIASTPITVLHAGRFGKGWLDGHSRHFWFAWILLALVGSKASESLGRHVLLEWLLIALGGIGLVLAEVFKEKLEEKSKDKPEMSVAVRLLFFSVLWAFLIWGAVGRLIGNLCPHILPGTTLYWIASLPVIWIGFGQYTVLYRLLTDREKFFDWYADLFKSRRLKNARDIRDTYTHLREHSNSIFVVVVELAMLAFILAAIKSAPAQVANTTQLESFGRMLLIALPIWMIPTVFMWARANAMEDEFRKNSKRFMKDD